MKKIISIILLVVVVIVLFIVFGSPRKPESVNNSSVNSTSTVTSTATTTSTLPSPKKAGFSLSDIASHNNENSCWTAIDGQVYDVTPFINSHPGGKDNILKSCGIDATELFKMVEKHSGTKAQNSLSKGLIGPLIN